MIDESKEELAASYALGIMEPGEASAFEAVLQSDPKLRDLVNDLQNQSAVLAHAAPGMTPPKYLREKILRSISMESDEKRNVVTFHSASPIRWLPWAIAASFAVICGVLFSDRAKLKDEVAALQNQNEVAQMQVAMLDPTNAGKQQGLAVVVWDTSTQSGVFKGENMPLPAANQDYQLWVVDSRYPQAVNAGVFSVDSKGGAKATFKPAKPVSGVKFAVSIERKGGVEKNEGPIVMVSK